MKRFCLALDLIDDPILIGEYEQYHKKVWPEIESSILDAGIISMEIYRYANRLFMIMDTEDDFSFEKKKESDAASAKVQEWENLMWNYQTALPGAQPGEKWMLMEPVFNLSRSGESRR